jgi:hypothetical protein
MQFKNITHIKQTLFFATFSVWLATSIANLSLNAMLGGGRRKK